jgi:UDP-N-acetylmuramate dehydrogenase
MAIQWQQGVQLAAYTTFYIGGPAQFFAEVSTQAELAEAVDFANPRRLPLLILGGGSNMLVSDAGFAGVVVRPLLTGLEIIDTEESCVRVRFAAGEVWDDVVAFCVSHSLWGVENLSHIPGLSGAFVVQNVGAYGQDASQVVVQVEAYDREARRLVMLSKDECRFGYRSSIFNTTHKGRYVVTSVTAELSKRARPNLSYPDLAKLFSHTTSPDIAEIRQAIIAIRNKKFPFPNNPQNGNSGSFFKNCEVSDAEYKRIAAKIGRSLGADAVARLEAARAKLPSLAGKVKIPSALLIDLCGLKGYESGGVRVNPSQPLALLNASGQASAREVMEIFRHVRTAVYEKTGAVLAPEPEFVGFSAKELANSMRL